MRLGCEKLTLCIPLFSICKAGVICTVPARVSILAAANPIGGHYNKAKTVSENLKMSPAILSRFDLIFILLDRYIEVRRQGPAIFVFV